MIKFAHTTNNTIKIKTYTKDDKCKSSSAFELKCPACEQMYVGQTSRFITIYEEHTSDIRHNKDSVHCIYCNIIMSMAREVEH
jgi:hypothetical protein